MFKKILTTLQWSFSIGNKFFRVVPGITSAILLATLVSQLSILLAFLLPLKILMLLGTSGIPHYFPSIFENADRDFLVLSLSVLAAAFYLIFLIAERVVAICSSRGSALLLERSHKIALFESQEEVASRGYQRYSRSLAASVFLLLAAALLFWLYPELLTVLVVYIIVVFCFFSIKFSRGGRLAESLNETPGRVVSTATSIGFLLSFFFMVMHFLLGEPPSILIAIVSLILMRQGFSRIIGLVNDLKGLYAQRLKINALFFHGHFFINETKKHETNFWSLIKSPQREEWMLEVLKNITSEPVANIKANWWQLGGQDVAAFRVQSFNREGILVAEHLVKLFSTNRSSLAKHEANLLLGDTILPTLPLAGIEQVEGLNCHVFEWLPAKKLPMKQLNAARTKIMGELLSVEPEKKLVSQFSRSRPYIWQRIDSRMWERLHTVAEMLGSDYVGHVERISKVQDIQRRLRELPLTIVNPEIGADALLKTNKGKLLLAHWGRWSLEPVGAAWPTQPNHLERFADALEAAKVKRKALCDVRVEDASVAALMYSLEKKYIRQDFVGALELIPRILQCLETRFETSNTSA